MKIKIPKIRKTCETNHIKCNENQTEINKEQNAVFFFLSGSSLFLKSDIKDNLDKIHRKERHGDAFAEL